MLTLPQPLNFRNSNDDDYAFFTVLYSSTRDDLRQLDLPQEKIQELIRQQQLLQEKGMRDCFPHAQYFVVENEGQSVGRVVLDCEPDNIRLVNISLIPSAKGKGIGRAVMQTLQLHAQQHQLSLNLAVFQFNTPARNLYLSCGFTVLRNDGIQDHMIWRSNAQQAA